MWLNLMTDRNRSITKQTKLITFMSRKWLPAGLESLPFPYEESQSDLLINVQTTDLLANVSRKVLPQNTFSRSHPVSFEGFWQTNPEIDGFTGQGFRKTSMKQVYTQMGQNQIGDAFCCQHLNRTISFGKLMGCNILL